MIFMKKLTTRLLSLVLLGTFIPSFVLADNWDLAADSLQHHLELARDKAESVIKVIRLW